MFLKKSPEGQQKSGWVLPAYWLISILYFELLLHLAAFSSVDIHSAYAVGFSAAAAFLAALLLSFAGGKVYFVLSMALSAVLTVFYGSQMVYNFVFASLYSVASLQQGGDAVTSFWRETLMTMAENILWLAVLLLPVIVLCLLYKYKRAVFAAASWKCRFFLLLLTVLLQAGTVESLSIGGTGHFTDYYFYYNNSTSTEQATERFGLLTAFRLELIPVETAVSANQNTYYAPVEKQEIPQEEKVEYNVLEIDFDALNTMTEDERILALNAYCAGLTGTNKNAYTGMLKDYNLILLCAESFATGAIHEELTPNLYRLANEGIIFNNFYNSYRDTTTDGEYTLCMGLYPDITRNKAMPSFYASRNSYLPFCLGNLFQEQRGLSTYGYHNYLGDYYGRDETHPNMGYTTKFSKAGMWFTTTWPASDLEMMEQSVDDYLSADQQFHAYYMTFSGHYKYDRTVNMMVERNYSTVAKSEYGRKLGYNAQCYLSCNIELDKALGYLMQRLEETGVADKTAIVLVGDHFPYGLTDAQYSELVGYEIDPFTKFKSTLIFWVGGLEENIEVDTYCSTADILPTILNLWGFEYDSRMLAGNDVFSDGEHVAILRDRSFFTDKVWMNANKGEIRYLVDESQLPPNYVENMIQLVETRFSISSEILNTAYYNFVFGKDAVKIAQDAW